MFIGNEDNLEVLGMSTFSFLARVRNPRGTDMYGVGCLNGGQVLLGSAVSISGSSGSKRLSVPAASDFPPFTEVRVTLNSTGVPELPTGQTFFVSVQDTANNEVELVSSLGDVVSGTTYAITMSQAFTSSVTLQRIELNEVETMNEIAGELKLGTEDNGVWPAWIRFIGDRIDPANPTGNNRGAQLIVDNAGTVPNPDITITVSDPDGSNAVTKTRQEIEDAGAFSTPGIWGRPDGTTRQARRYTTDDITNIFGMQARVGQLCLIKIDYSDPNAPVSGGNGGGLPRGVVGSGSVIG